MNQKPFAVFDIDGTIFRSSLLIEIVLACVRSGVFPEDSDIQLKSAYRLWRNRASLQSYNDYMEQVIIAFEKHIKGVSKQKFELIVDGVVEDTFQHTYVYTRDLMKQLKKTHVLLAISGSPYELVDRFVAKYGFDDYVATEYHTVDGVYNGKATKAHTGKDKILKDMVAKHNLKFDDSIAVGDTAGDIALLKSVANPIAFNPDKTLKETAIENGWKIVVERKSQIYKLESENGQYKLA